MTLSKPRLPLVALCLFSAALLGAGVHASHLRAQRAQDTTAARSPAAAAQNPGRAPTSPAASAAGIEERGGSAAAATAPGALRSASESAQAAPPSAAEAVRQAQENVATPLWERLISVAGLIVMLLLGWLMSANRKILQWRVIIWGTLLQVVFAVFILKTALGELIFSKLNDVVIALLGFTVDGARFLFGNLVYNNVPIGTGVTGNGAFASGTQMVANTGATFAFSVLPTIIFFSSLMTVLYYFGVMQKVVQGMAWVMQRTMRTSGAETLSAAGNIFLGQTEAPLLIKPFVAKMTMSELMAVMTGGFATVAGGVMAAYVGMLHTTFPDIAGHLMAASVMSAPAALVFAKLMFPETERPLTRDSLRITLENPDANVIDAAARGAGEGLGLALNVGAMLLAFIALIAVINALLGLFGDLTHVTSLLVARGWLAHGQRLGLEAILGWALAPLAWIMGVPWRDATTIGSLLGIKTALNEFVGYLRLADLLNTGHPLSPRSVIIATYAMCGFANFSSIAIQIGGIGGMAPGRRSDLARIGMRAMIAGTLASFMTAAIAGILV